MDRFAIYEPRAVVNRELDESIEVDVNTTAKTVCASYSSFTFYGSSAFSTAPYTETIDVTNSYESGERAIDDIISGLEGSGKKSSALKGKGFNIKRTRTEETSMGSWLSSPSSEVNEYGGIVETVSFTFCEPSTVVNKEFDESIEVEVDTITKTVCASYCLFTSHSNNFFLRRSNTETIGIVTNSYDRSDRAIDGLSLELEVSEKKSLADKGSYINIERTLTAEISRALVPSSDCQQDGMVVYLADDEDEIDANGRTEDGHGSVLTKCLVGEIVKSIEDKGEGIDINIERTWTEETSVDSWPSVLSSECQEDGEIGNSTNEDETDANGRTDDGHESVVTKCLLVGEIVKAIEDEGPDFEVIKNKYANDVYASSEDQEDEFTNNVTEDGPKVEGISVECVVGVVANRESKDETENLRVFRSAAFSDKLASMMRNPIQTIQSICDVHEVENEQGKSSRHADQCYLLCSIFSSNLLLQHSTDIDEILAKSSSEAKILHNVEARFMILRTWTEETSDFNSETSNSVAKSYDSGERAIDELFSGLEESGKKSSAKVGKEFNIERTRMDKTSVDSWPLASSSDCQQDGDDTDETDDGRTGNGHGSVVTDSLEGEIVNATDGESPDVNSIKNNYVTDVYASSDAQEDVFICETERGPKVKGIAGECVVVVDSNRTSKDETENIRACRTGAFSDKLASMMRDPIQAIQSIRDVHARESEQGKSSRHPDQCYLIAILV